MRVVICDDHQLLVTGLAAGLARWGCVVEAAVMTTAEAVRAVELHDPDLLLIDLTFPSGSGLDAARQVTTRHPRTRVVLLTGSDAPGPLAEALEIGVAGYLRKVQRIDQIAAALVKVTAGEKVIDRELLRGLRRPATVPKQRRASDGLTSREEHVLELLGKGMSTSDIAMAMGVSGSTVRTHVQSIFQKLGVHSRLEAVATLDRGPSQGEYDRVDR
jgi:DNA-binding NarL/FixJ family response regulator